MVTHSVEPVSKQLTIIVGLTVVGFMAFGLALSYYRNVLFEHTLSNIAKQNDVLRDNIAQGYRDLQYFESTQYKDKYAKENLGLVNPGEKVLIITQEKSPLVEEADETYRKERQEAAYYELLRQMPVIEHWKLYFFQQEKVEGLKRGL